MEETNMFVYIQTHNCFNGDYYDTVYHKDTKVMYAIFYGYHNQGGFTMLVNPDGSPMLYKESEE